MTAHTAAETLVATAIADLAPIELPDLITTAARQTRFDRKYFVPASIFAELVDRLRPGLLALELAGRRMVDYESVYFDTPDLLTYRAQLQRRRRRYKIRTRCYLDSGDCVLEVKLKGPRGVTIKHRTDHPAGDRWRLTVPASRYLAGRITELYPVAPPTDLSPVLTTRYRRATLVLPADGARLTCDVGLSCRALPAEDRPGLRARPEYVMVESKADLGGSSADRLLGRLGVRPVAVSKYAVAVAGLRPDLPSNPWHRTLRRYFDWPLTTDSGQRLQVCRSGPAVSGHR